MVFLTGAKLEVKTLSSKRVLRIFRQLSAIIVGTALSLSVLESLDFKSSKAFVIFNRVGDTIAGGSRWDAEPRTINGAERSLNRGLRYSLQGGSYEAYRDLFSWETVPSADLFQEAIEGAFKAWTVVDPVSELGTDLFFVADLGTPVVGTGAGGVNPAGAEIDLLAATDALFWNQGNNFAQGEAFFDDINDTVTLTSGTVDYPASRAISGADITINNNPGAVYSLEFFRRLLTHEIGHTLGFGDVEGDINPGAFIDDNYNGSASLTALETLTNPIAQLVNPFDPATSPFSLFTVPDANLGVDTPGVNILMESRGLGIANDNPLENLTPLMNDDYAGRQFLYPVVKASASVPEASSIVGLLVFVILGVVKTVKGSFFRTYSK